MPRVEIAAEDWLNHPGLARETYQRMTQEGILLAVPDRRGKLNLMTIGWGVFGGIWGRPMFVVLVRPSRYTYDCLEHTGDFTVNVLPAEMRGMADYCGTTSGRDLDKLAQQKLTLLPSKHIRSGGIGEANIIFECQVVQRNNVVQAHFPEEILSQYYPQGDYHGVYFGQILGLSVAREFLDSLA